MEPVEIELRLRNLLSNPVRVDSLLNPEYDRVSLFIRSPDGKTNQYVPVIHKESESFVKVLQPVDSKLKGADRYSENVVITYGKGAILLQKPRGVSNKGIISRIWRYYNIFQHGAYTCCKPTIERGQHGK